jgi:PEP-CTERM motif
MFPRKLFALVVPVSLLLGAASSHATLVQVGPSDLKGTGLGNVNTILTVHDNDGTESGSVGLNLAGTEVTSGDTQAITQTLTLGELGVTSASLLRVVFNASEPGGSGIDLDDLVLTIFSPTGTPLFSSGAFTPASFTTTNPGVGNPDIQFKLDDAQAAAAQASAFGPGFADNVVGLSASLSAAQGGQETFFVTQAIPEPGTWALLVAGLIGVAGMARRRLQ